MQNLPHLISPVRETRTNGDERVVLDSPLETPTPVGSRDKPRGINFILLLLLVLATNIFASTINSNKNISLFNIELASKKIENINSQLSAKKINIENSKRYRTELRTLQNRAKSCVKTSENKIKTINEVLTTHKLDKQISSKSKNFRYLNNKKAFYQYQLAECKFFMFRSQEVIATLNITAAQLGAYNIMKRNPPIWRTFDKDGLFALQLISVEKIYNLSGIKKFTMENILTLFLLIIFGVALSIYIIHLCNHWLNNYPDTKTTFSSLVKTIRNFNLPVIIFGIISIFVATIFHGISPKPTIGLSSYIFLIYFFIIATLYFCFYANKGENNFFNLPVKLSKAFFVRSTVIATILLFGYFLFYLFRQQPLSPQLLELIRSIDIIILSIAIVWLCWLFTKIPLINRKTKTLNLTIKISLILLLLFSVAVGFLGYYQLAIFLLRGVLLTAVLIGILIAAIKLEESLLNALDNYQYLISQKIHYYLGLESYKKIPELVILRIVLYATIISISVVWLLKIWQVPETYINQLETALISGFTVGDLTIIPLRVVIASIVFIIILLSGRIIAAYLQRNTQFEGEKDTQVAVASIIIYSSFIVALAVALLITGVNFTGIAIIAGALSVGIGLGLQTIVNNFVSGIILLLEKPIKPGDRVIVGNTEGFVKKIRIRSTQITTIAKEDIIVPNSELITQQVTNYMFQDKYWRVTCQVGVAYGSDINLVKKVLLEIAANHADVIQTEPNKPQVLFRSFSDSSLVFELWCVIPDVNKKAKIRSELNFAIDEAFQKNNITIAFPQRDVHIKDYSSMPKS